MTRRLTRIIPGAAALLAAAALAACSGGSDAPDTPVNNGDNEVEVIDETPQNIAEPEPTPTPSPTNAPIVQDERGTDEQVQDDADAVGMTARLPRDQSGNEAVPVE